MQRCPKRSQPTLEFILERLDLVLYLSRRAAIPRLAERMTGR